MNKQKKLSLVLIEWEDANHQGAWHTPIQAKEWWENKENYLCRNVGFLLHEDKKCVVVASRLAKDNDVGMLQRIPRNWVQKIYFIKESFKK